MKGDAFTEREDAVLRLHYSRRGPRYCADLLPSRAYNSVKSRARRLGLDYIGPKQSAFADLADWFCRGRLRGEPAPRVEL